MRSPFFPLNVRVLRNIFAMLLRTRAAATRVLYNSRGCSNFYSGKQMMKFVSATECLKLCELDLIGVPVFRNSRIAELTISYPFFVSRKVEYLGARYVGFALETFTRRTNVIPGLAVPVHSLQVRISLPLTLRRFSVGSGSACIRFPPLRPRNISSQHTSGIL